MLSKARMQARYHVQAKCFKQWWTGLRSMHVSHLWAQNSLGWGWQGHNVKHGLQREASHVNSRPPRQCGICRSETVSRMWLPSKSSSM